MNRQASVSARPRLRWLIRAVVVCGLALFCTGCGSLLLHTSSGFVSSMKMGHRDGGAVNFHIDGGSRYLAIGSSLRMKFASAFQQVGMGPEAVFFAPRVGPVTFYGRFGVHVSQFESLDSKFKFGMGSPYAELGLMLRVYYIQLSFSAAIEHSVRFGAFDESYWSALFGIAILYRK